MRLPRRHFLGLAAPLFAGCRSPQAEEAATRSLRRVFSADTNDHAKLMRELVRYATLAPSSHNTQAWRFGIATRSISVAPDLSRRCPVVDPDDHHLFVSLGCATENLAQAALAHGLHADVHLDVHQPGNIELALQATQPKPSLLYQAIPMRQCTRGDYDGKPLSADELRLLERAGSGIGVRVLLLTASPAMEQVLAYVVAGNSVQLDTPAFVAELKTWIRFDAAEALRKGDGLYAGASGQPTLPRWLASPLMGMLLTAESENDRYARQVRSSAGIAVFVSAAADTAHWVETGRCYERFALQATALGVRNAFLNQLVEVSSIRPQFAAMLGLGAQRPDLVVRFGRGPVLPMSMRRPLDAVLT